MKTLTTLFSMLTFLRVLLPVQLCLVIAFAEHPRLFFSAQEIPDIRTKYASSHATICAPIVSKAQTLETELVPTYPANPSYSEFRKAAEDIRVLAFAYVLTGEKKYATKTKEYLIELASWPHWGGAGKFGQRDLCLGFLLNGAAFSYDWMYDQLSADERITIRNAIGKHAQEMYEAAINDYNSDWQNWWSKSYVQNHWTSNVCALGIAALALEGEDDRAKDWLHHAVEEMKKEQYLNNSILDGTWHEGIQYQNGKLLSTLPFFHNLKRLKNEDIVYKKYLNNYVLWILYNYLPGLNHCAMAYGSYVRFWGGWSAGQAQVNLRFVASYYGNEYAEWIAQQIIALGRNTYQAPWYIFEFFYYDPSIQPKEPKDLPLSRTFPDLEGVIWRTGWGANDLTFALKTGPYGGRTVYTSFLNKTFPFDITGSNVNTGHDHQDCNSFYLYKGSIDLASEMGDRHGTSEGMSFHNTLMVDDLGQYQPINHAALYEKTDGKLETVLPTPGYDFLISDATNRYRRRNNDGPGSPGNFLVDEFKRRVLFVRPDYFIMLDNISSDSLRKYEWVCHFSDSGQIKVENEWVKGVSSSNEILGIKVLHPPGFTDTTGFSPYTNNTNLEKPYIRIRPGNTVLRTQFIMALLPMKAEQWNNKPPITLVHNNDTAAIIRVEKEGLHDHIIPYHSSQKISIGEYSLSGKCASIERDAGGKLLKLFLGKGTEVSDSNGTRVLIQSPDTNCTAEARYNGTELALFGDSLRGLKIYGPEIKVNNITVNNAVATAVKEGNYITIVDFIDIKMKKNFFQNGMISVFEHFNRAKPKFEVAFDPSLSGRIQLLIYRVNGELVWKKEKLLAKGSHQYFSWYCTNQQGKRVGKGIYIIRLSGIGINLCKKITLLR